MHGHLLYNLGFLFLGLHLYFIEYEKRVMILVWG